MIHDSHRGAQNSHQGVAEEEPQIYECYNQEESRASQDLGASDVPTKLTIQHVDETCRADPTIAEDDLLEDVQCIHQDVAEKDQQREQQSNLTGFAALPGGDLYAAPDEPTTQHDDWLPCAKSTIMVLDRLEGTRLNRQSVAERTHQRGHPSKTGFLDLPGGRYKGRVPIRHDPASNALPVQVPRSEMKPEARVNLLTRLLQRSEISYTSLSATNQLALTIARLDHRRTILIGWRSLRTRNHCTFYPWLGPVVRYGRNISPYYLHSTASTCLPSDPHAYGIQTLVLRLSLPIIWADP